ncbi:VOC family protein [Henriciella aquimarina]|uniref:VOC family protein n=1 Tax=Henriciella aquimarina TaxID=545261 RepID=UPI00117B9A2F|nr:VOC family protein [Henriciella aquimarina]
MDISGMAHLIITAGNFKASTDFYRELLPAMGLQIVEDSEEILYCVGARTALGIRKPDPAHAGERANQWRVGLHHYCFRAKNRETVDQAHKLVMALGGKIIHAPEEGPWAPGYYSVLFEDPDGIRGEVNHVPGKGVLAEGAEFRTH